MMATTSTSEANNYASKASSEKDQIAFINAVKNDQESEVRSLISAGVDVNITDESGNTGLIYAIRNGNESMVDVLIHAGADVNVYDDGGCTALWNAAAEDKERLIRALIEAGVDVNRKNTTCGQFTALFHAVKKNNQLSLKALINAGADVNIQDIEGDTALVYALSYSIVYMLVEAGADVNISNKLGQTPLFGAVYKECETVFEALINAGADVNITNNQGWTPLFLAVGSDNVVIEDGYYYEPIHYSENVLQTLIKDNTASVNARDNYGRTPLFYAIVQTPEAADYLIKNGANIHSKDNNNMDILSFFVEYCIKERDATVSLSRGSEAFDLLVQQGLKPKIFVEAIINIVFCISLACDLYLKDQLEITTSTLSEALTAPFNLLDDNDDNIKKKSIIKNVLELLEKQKGCLLDSRIFDLLFQLGANPNSTDSHGNTALHYVTYLPSSEVPQETIMEICLKLEQLGVNFNIKNQENQNPLLLCLSCTSQIDDREGEPDYLLLLKSTVEVCRFLLGHGTSVSDTSKNGKSSLHLMLHMFKKNVGISNKEKRCAVLQELKTLLYLILPRNIKERKMLVNRSNNELNAPLHLWAEIYNDDDLYDDDFEELLKEILKLLLDSGAILNPRNLEEETPLHQCKTWCAAKLLLDAGANPNAVDSTGNTTLLVAAKQSRSDDKLYPDVKEDPKTFWRSTVKKELNPWVVNKLGESVLSILVTLEKFLLAEALVDFMCDGNYFTSDATITTSLLNTICKDKSSRTHWKSNLVETLLKASKGKAVLGEPLHLCCKNMVEFGVHENKKIKKSIQLVHTTSEDEVEQPPSKKHKLDHSTEEEASTEYTNTSEERDSVHCKIAKLLLCYGADPKSLDSSGKSCLDIAENCPALKELLTKPINIDEFPQLIPWTSISEKYKDRLAKVARRKECKVDGTLWYHIECIGSGSFGHVFAGINEKDGREVAIKRIEKLRMKGPEIKREVKSLLSLVGCENIVRYLSIAEDEEFSYVVLELTEGDLNSLDDKKVLPIEVRVQLCKDVLVGVGFLHNQNIIHRDLKPSNILYKTHPRLCLKIADFGLSRCIDSTSATTVYGSNVGSRCWMAPEVLKGTKKHSTSSDIFSCGLVLHFILSTKRHPFSPAVYGNKSEAVLNNETERNVLNGKMEGWDSSLSPEATHLVKDMLDVDEKKPRLSAVEALKHPLFWSSDKKMDFLTAVGNQPEFECPRARKRTPFTPLEIDLEKRFGMVVKYASWNDPGYKQMSLIYSEIPKTKRTSYDTKSVVELVRFIRNAKAHVSHKGRTTTCQKLILEDFIFLEYFPSLVMEVFKSVKTHGWDQTRKEIKCTINK